MARVWNVNKIYEINYELNEPQPYVGKVVNLEEWDETGTTIVHKIEMLEILEIQPYQAGDKWMLKYIIRGR